MFKINTFRKYKHILKVKILFLSFIVSILFLPGCYFNTPAHTVVITGDLFIHENINENLCFEPNLESTLAPFPYKTAFIRMDELRIIDANSLSMLMTIKPKHKNYLIIHNGDIVCLDPINPIMERVIFTHPEKGQKLAAQIGGLDEKKEHFVTFSVEFEYPY